MNNPGTSTNPHLDEVNALRQHLLELEESHSQCQQQIQQLQLQLDQERTARQQAEEQLQLSLSTTQTANERFELAAKAVNCLIYDWHLASNRVERTGGADQATGLFVRRSGANGPMVARSRSPR